MKQICKKQYPSPRSCRNELSNPRCLTVSINLAEPRSQTNSKATRVGKFYPTCTGLWVLIILHELELWHVILITLKTVEQLRNRSYNYTSVFWNYSKILVSVKKLCEVLHLSLVQLTTLVACRSYILKLADNKPRSVWFCSRLWLKALKVSRLLAYQTNHTRTSIPSKMNGSRNSASNVWLQRK